MSDAQAILRRAHERADARYAARPRPDYTAANKLFRRQKAALTRAVNSGDAGKVVLACERAVREWNADHPCAGMWPDDWSRWQSALDDVLPWNAHVALEDL